MDWSRYYTCAFPPSILGYIKDYQVYDPHRVGRITVELQGRVKDCKALTYRQDIKARDIENYRLRMLPTHQVCHILMFNILSWMLIFLFILEKAWGKNGLCVCVVNEISLVYERMKFLFFWLILLLVSPSLHAVGLCCNHNSGWCFGSRRGN